MTESEEYVDFIENWNRLTFELHDELPTQFLQPNGFQDINEMSDVIENAGEGIKENGLLRLKNVRNYLINVRDDLNADTPFVDHHDEEAWEIHQEKIDLVNYLINALQPQNYARMADILTPEDIIVLRNMRRQKRIPEDMEREISSFVGIKPEGGRNSRRKNKKRKTRKSKKAKKSRKTKKSRKAKKY
jgi:hypothetical protein